MVSRRRAALCQRDYPQVCSCQRGANRARAAAPVLQARQVTGIGGSTTKRALRARRIIEAREKAPIVTTRQLVAAVGQTIFRGKGAGGGGRGGRGGKTIHPATRTFQVGLGVVAPPASGGSRCQLWAAAAAASPCADTFFKPCTFTPT